MVFVAFVAACGSAGNPSSRATPEATSSPTAPPSAASTPAGVAWSPDRVVSRLDGRRIRVEGRTVPIDDTTLTCTGVGRAASKRGERVWTRFRCVQPTFPPGRVVGPDAVLVVEPTGHRTLKVVEARFTRY
jgi:hypothetical protein